MKTRREILKCFRTVLKDVVSTERINYNTKKKVFYFQAQKPYGKLEV